MDAFVSLENEHFKIRETEDEHILVNAELSPSKRDLQRLARRVQPLATAGGDKPSSAEAAVERSRVENQGEAGWYICTKDDETLDGDRFRI